ncbi:Octicosapeptide/Phox/Bem1p domain-containing protein / tetratricopeptide repeat-containing protein [Hibiscus syriacus]|uniref:Octicosapeptide/Phox/Bem1p domain-containing protein / tetratricopeptide repeat-containing protein n=1 Tax=Hibiscus syriacus TaxID=106335 RepID=A0A6A2W9E9_HIBSY|nr:Octicosapeptide/Phox/Bem1p domain-containing protein / tetratricopeptide repeat-containing protein [Hibiscus syriacus]
MSHDSYILPFRSSSSGSPSDGILIFFPIVPCLHKLNMLNLEGCNVTAACLDSISALVALAYLNLGRCGLTDDGCDKFSGLKNLKVLNLAFNDITDACLVHLKELVAVDLVPGSLWPVTPQKSRVVHTEVGSNGLRHLSGLTHLETLNLSFTLVTDSGLKKLSGLTALKSLNLDARQITDVGLSALISLTGLVHLDLFGARISDIGTNYLRCFKNLQSLEICGGGLTDVGVKNIKDLRSLTLPNLSQNCNLKQILGVDFRTDRIGVVKCFEFQHK